MPITFPDGRRVELSYPRSLAAGVPAIRTGASVVWSVRPEPFRCCTRNLIISHRSIQAVYDGLEPITTYRDRDGAPVHYFDGVGRSAVFDILAFQFGRWLVEVHDRRQPGDFEGVMSEEERATWARSLGGRVDEHGYLVLDARPPLRVGPSANAVVFLPTGDGVEIVIAEGSCGFPASDTSTARRFLTADGGGVSWCDERTGLHVSVEGQLDLVDAVTAGLELRALTRGFVAEKA